MMAAGGGAVRLRLVFDHPPPASPGCALCWLLLEPGQARLVTDLLSLIRHRFGYSRRARLSLFLQGALLPPGESARLVRDNDSLRVKLEEMVADDDEEIDDGFAYATKEDKKKQSQGEEEFSRKEGKRKRKRKKEKRNLEYSSSREESSVDIWDSQKRHTKRRKKEEVSGRNRLAEGKEESSTAHSKKHKKTERELQLSTKTKEEKQKKAAAKMALEQANESFSLNSGKSSTKKIATQPRKKRVGASDSSSTSSDSDSSELNVKENKSSNKPVVATLPKDKPQAASNSDVKTNKVTAKSNTEKIKTAVNKNAENPQSSSSDSSAEDEVTPAQESTAKAESLPKPEVAAKASTKAPQAQSSSSDSASSDSDALVVQKSAADAALGSSMARSCTSQLPASAQGQLAGPGHGKGRATGQETCRAPRGRGFRGMMRGRGQGRATKPGFFYNYSSEGQKQRQSNRTTISISTLVQNPEAIPKRDYNSLPLLAAPPQVGERIAFKRLELTENYTPEVSDYKEAKITGWNAEKRQIELELLSSSGEESAKEPGKFDLVYRGADGAELVEYAVPQDTKITESWDALIEPRLIVGPPLFRF